MIYNQYTFQKYYIRVYNNYNNEIYCLLLRKMLNAIIYFCRYTPTELIVKHGPIEKRKGLFAKKRQLILTDSPRLVYIDPVSNEMKGEIPWSTALNVEVKNPRTFFIHTPSRTYYLEDLNNGAQAWADAIDKFIKKPTTPLK